MRDGLANLEALNPDQRVDAVAAAVLDLLDEIGIYGAGPDSVIAAPRFYKGPVLCGGKRGSRSFHPQVYDQGSLHRIPVQ